MDVSGGYGQRETFTFKNDQYTYTSENCLILSGNQGSYINSDSATGTFSIGAITLSSSTPSLQMRALDIIRDNKTLYTSYNITGNILHIALPFEKYDGSTSENRAFQTASFYDPTSQKLITNPTYIKQ